LLNCQITLDKTVKLSVKSISRLIHDGLSKQPKRPPPTEPPNYADIHNSKSHATSSKVTRVNLEFLLTVHQSTVPLVANLMQRNGHLQLDALTFSLA